ncbi:MAG: polyprenyl synthetase family protein [Myxococcales bacterium]|nr:polyprenyl synthetase family protein [Myxococcales bacterium]
MSDLASRLSIVRQRVDDKLVAYLESKLAEARAVSPDSIELVEGIRDLTLRGGKRLRPIVLDAAYRAVRPEGDEEASTPVGAALEVLQSYLLIHDDWMDQDDERRGGPATHKLYRDAGHEAHLAACLAVLAGDLASAYAWELFFETRFPTHRQAEANARFITIQKEVFFGQHLDITANPDVSRMHDLKTGSYTVRGPLVLGALLGDASEGQLDALLRWGNPLGEAFQLADDLLGTFGDVGETGKPGDDLQHRKRTSLVAEAERLLPMGRRDALDALMAGKGIASDVEAAAAAELLVTSGAKANVEARLRELHAAATAVLDAAPLDPRGAEVLRHVADKLALRTS